MAAGSFEGNGYAGQPGLGFRLHKGRRAFTREWSAFSLAKGHHPPFQILFWPLSLLAPPYCTQGLTPPIPLRNWTKSTFRSSCWSLCFASLFPTRERECRHTIPVSVVLGLFRDESCCVDVPMAPRGRRRNGKLATIARAIEEIAQSTTVP